MNPFFVGIAVFFFGMGIAFTELRSSSEKDMRISVVLAFICSGIYAAMAVA